MIVLYGVEIGPASAMTESADQLILFVQDYRFLSERGALISPVARPNVRGVR